ncbi:MAG: DUF5399 family protein [Chlamydiae bacterium]|nr:DUF5399 family protein [Chlamydiota bacterium]
MAENIRTVDNLGADTSVSYAQRAEELEKLQGVLAPGRGLPTRTEVAVVKPAPSEIDLLLGITQSAWAQFSLPHGNMGNILSNLGLTSQLDTDTLNHDIDVLKATVCSTDEEAKQKEILLKAADQALQISKNLDAIRRALTEFLGA